MPVSKRAKKHVGGAVRDPRARFVELANKRVTSAIQQLRLIGNLANRKNYEYDAEDAKKVIRVLQRELDNLKMRFKGEDKDANSIFNI